MKKLWIISFVFCTAQVGLWGDARFDLPAATPGLIPEGNLLVPNCVYVRIPGTTCDLYFPKDGSQPNTPSAGAWSGASHVGRDNDDAVTDWWVRAFGGRNAVLASRDGGDPYSDPKMGFCNKKVGHIIQIDKRFDASENFERQFWQTFRQLAGNPIGRVLLYRLLIEIRRKDSVTEKGCCGDDVLLPEDYILDTRNNCRAITFRLSYEGCSFNEIHQAIYFVRNDAKTTTVLSIENGFLTTRLKKHKADISLFHEMVHWFHYLRNPDKTDDNRSKNPKSFRYAMRCYYGYISDLCAWGNINAEEIATILGCPDLNSRISHTFDGEELVNTDAFPRINPGNGSLVLIDGITQYVDNRYSFLNGDDLSENVYRASQGEPMRWGHVSSPIHPIVLPFPKRFLLAYQIARICYFAIMGDFPRNWALVQGQAIQ